MNDVKSAIAKNIVELRRQKGMTQLELAEKLNYSDKAVSKWEHGESLPDVTVLVEIAELFEVTLDELVRLQSEKVKVETGKRTVRYSKKAITAIVMMLVALIATFVYVMLSILWKGPSNHWLCFVYALPVECIIWLVFNSLWFNPKRNYWIVSLLMWSVLLCVHVSLLLFHINISMIYLLGVPGQLIILFWRLMRRPKHTEEA